LNIEFFHGHSFFASTLSSEKDPKSLLSMPRHPERGQPEWPLSFVAARRFQWAAINATAIFQAGARSG